MQTRQRALAFLLGLSLLGRLSVAAETLSLSLTNDQGNLVLSWPAWATDGVLEESTNSHGSPSWTPVPAALYQADSDAFHCRFSAADQGRFFRLRRAGSPVRGLVGYWSLDEGAGQVAGDFTGLGTSLYMTNVSWAPGRIGGGSLRFNGGDMGGAGSAAWITNTDFKVLPPTPMPFSLSFWFNLDAIPEGWQEILGNDSGGADGWHVALNSPGPGTNYVVLGGTVNGTQINLSGRTLLLPGQWHQVTVACDTRQTRLYLDSRLLAQGAGGVVNHQGPLWIGGGDYPGFMGRLDELRVYTNLLTEAQVSLAGQWRFDENSGSLAMDGSIQGHPAAVVSPSAWTAGKKGSGLDLASGPVAIPNQDFSVLPASGQPFSISLWVCPSTMAPGRSDLLSCAETNARGWQMVMRVDEASRSWLELTSTNLGGTLSLRAGLSLTNGTWTKLDLTYNGGIATLYENGRKIAAEPGAILAAKAPLMLGGLPDGFPFNGRIDELEIYNREREASEIGPIALPMWEMALVNSSTNLLLPGAGPPGKLLTYSILSGPAPGLGTLSWSPGLPIVTYSAGSLKGPDTFVYTVSDGEFVSPPATGVVSVVQPHWLSPSGGATLPRDGSKPEQAWAARSAAELDEIWRTNNYYDCFFYAPGEYQTMGWKNNKRVTANPGCKHIGSGSSGTGATILKLVGASLSWEDGLIFGGASAFTDCFEVHDLVLDCNADNNPKFLVGEPIWMVVPLATTGRVDKVTLHWGDPTARQSPYQLGRPTEFSVGTRSASANGFVTNLLSLASTGMVDEIAVNAETDELLVRLDRRAPGVSFYGLRELELSGPAVSLPSVTIPGGGKSALDEWHSILMAVDQDKRTSWASGPEDQVQLALPLAAGTPVTQVNFQWNCQTLPEPRRLGAAATYFIYAHDAVSGDLRLVPFVTQGRQADGKETAIFGTAQSVETVFTDQLVILLAAREQGVDSYSLQEISVQNAGARVPLRMPTAVNFLGGHNFVHAFDGNTNTYWASGTQGSVTAVDVGGSNLKFTGLKVIGFGTKPGRECFPLAVIATAGRPPMSNVLVEDCIFTLPAKSGDGLTVVSVLGQGAGSLVNAVVRRCTVSGVRSYFGYTHAFTASRVENCFVDDCQFAVYFEPNSGGFDSIGPVLLRSNTFVNVAIGIRMDFHPDSHFDSVLCQDNEIVLSGPAGSGISVCDICAVGPSGTLTNLTALNNIVRYPGWAQRPTALDGGLFYGNIRHAIYGNNVIALGTPYALRVRAYPAGLVLDKPEPEDCDNPRLVIPGPSSYPPPVDILPPGYRRAWFNNRDFSGTLLPVRHTESGVDQLSVQQQWQE